MCIKMTAIKGSGVNELMLEATDAEIAMRLTLSQVDVLKAGQVLIPADKLRGIVAGEEAEPTLTFETDGDMCVIKGSDAQFKVFGYPAADFPPIPEFADVVSGKGEDAVAKLSLIHI